MTCDRGQTLLGLATILQGGPPCYPLQMGSFHLALLWNQSLSLEHSTRLGRVDPLTHTHIHTLLVDFI